MPNHATFQHIVLRPRTEKERAATWLHKELRRAIVSGRLRGGARLPSSRNLAEQYGLARGTVVGVFARLKQSGFLTSGGSAGTFVAYRALPTSDLKTSHKLEDGLCASLSRRAARFKPPFSSVPTKLSGVAFRSHEPALDLFPTKLWSRVASRVYHQAPAALYGRGDPRGYFPLRAAIAEYLGLWRGVRCSAAQIIITSGAQQALDLISRLLIDEGDEVWMEDPGNTGASQSLSAAGASLVLVPVDEEGLNVKQGVQSAPRAKLIYITPANQFPLGVCLSHARRKELLAWSASSGTWIIEDEYDAGYCYGERPEPALLSMEGSHNVVYVGTFTKLLFNAIRLGFIVLPHRIAETFSQARSFIDRHPPTLDQAVLADFIERGHFGHHLERMRGAYKERQACLHGLTGKYLSSALRLEPRAYGMSTIGWLPTSLSDTAVSSQLLLEGVEALPLSFFYSREPDRPGLILGFAGAGPEEMKRGVQALARLSERWTI